MKCEHFNQLIIIAEYSRASIEFNNHLEILEHCLNGAVDSSVMLIINKVPNKTELKKAIKENPNFDLDNNLKRLRKQIARVFKFHFSADFCLVNELDDDDKKLNDFELDRIRNVIGFSESNQFSNVKTWSELVEDTKEPKKNKEDQIKLEDQIKRNIEDHIQKDMANILYMESQLNFIDKGKSLVNDAFTSIKFLIKPDVLTNEIKLSNYKEEKKAQINKIKQEKELKDARLTVIKQNSVELKKEIEIHLNNINRLKKLFER